MSRSGASAFSDRLVDDWVEIFYVIVLLAAGGVVFYAGLGAYPLVNWDEGIYASIARVTLEDGTWGIPHSYYAGYSSVTYRPFLDKPPLLVWLQALSMSIHGSSDFAVRFPSATAALFTGLLTYIFGRALWNRRAGLFAGMVFMTIPYVYAGNNAARRGGTDFLLILFGTAFVFYVWLAQERERPEHLYVAAVAASLAFLAKGVAAGIFLFVLVPLVVVRRDVFLDTATLKAGIAAVVLAFAWPIYAFVTNSEMFIRVFVVNQIIERVLGTAGSHPGGLFDFMNYPYITSLPSFTDPWLFVFLPAIAYALYRSISANGSTRRNLLFVIWWVTVVFAFYLPIGSLAWYIMPMYVPFALLTGYFLADVSKRKSPAVLLMGIGALLVIAFSHRLPWPSLLPVDFIVSGATKIPSGVDFLLAFVALVCGLTVARTLTAYVSSGCRRRDLERIVYGVGVFVFVIATTVPPVALQASDWDASQARLGNAVDETAPEDATVFLAENASRETPFYSFTFYAERDVRSVTYAELRSNDTARYAIVTEAMLERIDRPYRVLASGVNRVGVAIAAVRFDRNGTAAESDLRQPIRPTQRGFDNRVLSAVSPRCRG